MSKNNCEKVKELLNSNTEWPDIIQLFLQKYIEDPFKAKFGKIKKYVDALTHFDIYSDIIRIFGFDIQGDYMPEFIDFYIHILRNKGFFALELANKTVKLGKKKCKVPHLTLIKSPFDKKIWKNAYMYIAQMAHTMFVYCMLRQEFQDTVELDVMERTLAYFSNPNAIEKYKNIDIYGKSVKLQNLKFELWVMECKYSEYTALNCIYEYFLPHHKCLHIQIRNKNAKINKEISKSNGDLILPTNDGKYIFINQLY